MNDAQQPALPRVTKLRVPIRDRMAKEDRAQGEPQVFVRVDTLDLMNIVAPREAQGLEVSQYERRQCSHLRWFGVLDLVNVFLALADQKIGFDSSREGFVVRMHLGLPVCISKSRATQHAFCCISKCVETLSRPILDLSPMDQLHAGYSRQHQDRALGLIRASKAASISGNLALSSASTSFP
jgi:hypothetical protein